MQNKLRQWPKDKYCVSLFVQVCEVVRFMGSENRITAPQGLGREESWCLKGVFQLEKMKEFLNDKNVLLP